MFYRQRKDKPPPKEHKKPGRKSTKNCCVRCSEPLGDDAVRFNPMSGKPEKEDKGWCLECYERVIREPDLNLSAKASAAIRGSGGRVRHASYESDRWDD